MKSITYIKRNLTNLNRSILSQLLQSEGVELTDELWNYLIETPWNTNWRLLEDFGIDIDEDSEGGSDTYTITSDCLSEWVSIKIGETFDPNEYWYCETREEPTQRYVGDYPTHYMDWNGGVFTEEVASYAVDGVVYFSEYVKQ